MDRCRIGLIGAGGVAERHARVLSSFPDAEVVAVADPDLVRAGALAGRYDAAAYPSHGAMLAEVELEGVYICVPPFAHGEPEWAAVEAGLPFFVEKPLALDDATAWRIGAAVADRGLLTAVGHHWRYLTAVERAQDLLVSRDVRLALGYWLDKVPPVPWWLHRDRSGGQVIEQAVHVLDLLRVLVGEVAEVQAVACATPPPGAGADGGPFTDAATAATLRFAGGAVGTLAATCLLRWKHQAGVQLFADGIALEVTETALSYDTGGGPIVIADDGAAKNRVDRAFVDAVLGRGDGIRASYGEALRTHVLACAIARAAQTGQPVSGENREPAW